MNESKLFVDGRTLFHGVQPFRKRIAIYLPAYTLYTYDISTLYISKKKELKQALNCKT